MHTNEAGSDPAPDILDQCRICGRRLRFVHSNHLKKHHMSAEEYKRRFGIPYLMPKAQRERLAALQPRGLPYVARNDDEIVAALQGYAKECVPLRYTYLRRHDKILLRQAERAFGGWQSALKAAGIRDCPRRRWSPEAVLRALEKRRRAGRPLNSSAIIADDLPLFSAVKRYFGRLEAALERLGVDYERVRLLRPRDDETYRRDLVNWCMKNGPLTPQGLKMTDANLYLTALKKYGSLRAVARKFGLPYRGIVKRWTKEMVAEALRAYHRAEGPISESKLQKQDGALYSAVRRHFGTLRSAADELYLPFQRLIKAWDKETVVQALKDRASAGLPLSATKVIAAGDGLVYAARRHFGSWDEARNAAGLGGDPRGNQGKGVAGQTPNEDR